MIRTILSVRVDQDLCCGFGNCWLAAPEVFEVDEVSGLAHATSDIVPDGLETKVRYAQERCPQSAIKVRDVAEGDSVPAKSP